MNRLCTVAVLGVYGHTGRFVVMELQRAAGRGSFGAAILRDFLVSLTPEALTLM